MPEFDNLSDTSIEQFSNEDEEKKTKKMKKKENKGD